MARKVKTAPRKKKASVAEPVMKRLNISARKLTQRTSTFTNLFFRTKMNSDDQRAERNLEEYGEATKLRLDAMKERFHFYGVGDTKTVHEDLVQLQKISKELKQIMETLKGTHVLDRESKHLEQLRDTVRSMVDEHVDAVEAKLADLRDDPTLSSVRRGVIPEDLSKKELTRICKAVKETRSKMCELQKIFKDTEGFEAIQNKLGASIEETSLLEQELKGL